MKRALWHDFQGERWLHCAKPADSPEGEEAISVLLCWFKIHQRPPGLIRQSFFSRKNASRIVSCIKRDMQRLHPEFEGPVRIPAKKTLIYVKKPGSAPKWLNFPSRVSCSLAANLSPRTEAIKSGHQRPPRRLTQGSRDCSCSCGKYLGNPRAERFDLPSGVSAAGKAGEGREHFPRIISFVRRILRLTLEE